MSYNISTPLNELLLRYVLNRALPRKSHDKNITTLSIRRNRDTGFHVFKRSQKLISLMKPQTHFLQDKLPPDADIELHCTTSRPSIRLEMKTPLIVSFLVFYFLAWVDFILICCGTPLLERPLDDGIGPPTFGNGRPRQRWLPPEDAPHLLFPFRDRLRHNLEKLI